MVMKRKTGKILSLVLAFVLAFVMLPVMPGGVTAKAAEKISTVSVDTISLLAGTKYADLFNGGVTYDESKMTLGEVQVGVSGSGTTENSINHSASLSEFQEQTSYDIVLQFNAKEDYTFEVTGAKVNGIVAMISEQNSTSIVLKISYTIPEATELQNVDIFVTPPKSGEVPDDAATVAEAQKDQVSVNGDIYWGYGETGSYPVKSNEGYFVGEREYTVRVTLKPGIGYKLTEETVCTINGNSATFNKENNTASYKFPPLRTLLQTASATCNLTTGTKLSEYDFGIAADEGYEVDDVAWYIFYYGESGAVCVSFPASVWDSATLDATRDYKLEFTLKAKTGYGFTDDTEFPIQVPDNAVVILGDTTLKEKKVTITFQKAVVGATNISIPLPNVGEKPSDITIESDNENCIVTKVVWGIPAGAMTETFEEGKTYYALISLSPTDRYLLWDINDYSKAWDGNEVANRITVNHAAIEDVEDNIIYNNARASSAIKYMVYMQPHTHAYGTEWSKDETNHFHVCSCGDKKDVAPHTFDAGVVTKEPTLSEEGEKTYTCSVCGYTETESIPKISKKDETPGTAKIAVSGISISGISKKLAAGKAVQLTAVITPENATNQAVVWKSSNTKYATVSSTGKVTLKKTAAGKTVTITATAADGSGKTASYKIKIMKDAVKKIKINAPAKTVSAGKSLKLKATVTTSGKNANKTLKWESSNTEYATVTKSGKVTANKAAKGKTVTITAMATDGSGKKAKIKIKIK